MNRTAKQNTTKKQACYIAWVNEIKHYEHVTLATVYRNAYRLPNGNWYYIGRAHDYTF